MCQESSSPRRRQRGEQGISHASTPKPKPMEGMLGEVGEGFWATGRIPEGPPGWSGIRSLWQSWGETKVGYRMGEEGLEQVGWVQTPS